MDAGRPLKLLLLDDDEDDYFIIRGLVADVWGSGAQVTWVQRIAAAQAALQRGPFDAALVDFNLGGENGLDFIRSVAGPGSLPCILITGYGSARLYRLARHAGAAGYIDKEYLSGPRLRRALELALRRR